MGPGNRLPSTREDSAGSFQAPANFRLHGTGVKLLALALVLTGGLLLHSAARGAVKDKQPTTRIVSGTVYDEAQNTIFGAAVELKDLQTGKDLEIYSQQNGEYQYADLRFDHDYTIRAMYKESSSEVRKISMFETRWHLVMNLTLHKPAK